MTDWKLLLPALANSPSIAAALEPVLHLGKPELPQWHCQAGAWQRAETSLNSGMELPFARIIELLDSSDTGLG